MRIFEVDFDVLATPGETQRIVYGPSHAVVTTKGDLLDTTVGLTEIEFNHDNKRMIAASIRTMIVSDDDLDEELTEILKVLERPTHAEYRANALVKIDGVHADFMRMLTGNATTEERDTWPAKVTASQFLMTASDEAANAAIALVTSDDPAAMDDLETLVQDVGPDLTTLRTLAVTILTKSRAYKRLIGLASRLRREAKDAITGITDDAQPIEDVGDALDAVEQSLTAQAGAAIAEWQGAS